MRDEKATSVGFFLLFLRLLFPEGRLWKMQRDEVGADKRASSSQRA